MISDSRLGQWGHPCYQDTGAVSLHACNNHSARMHSSGTLTAQFIRLDTQCQNWRDSRFSRGSAQTRGRQYREPRLQQCSLHRQCCPSAGGCRALARSKCATRIHMEFSHCTLSVWTDNAKIVRIKGELRERTDTRCAVSSTAPSAVFSSSTVRSCRRQLPGACHDHIAHPNCSGTLTLHVIFLDRQCQDWTNQG